MKIGIINTVRNHPSHPYPLEDVYADFISDAALRAAGLDPADFFIAPMQQVAVAETQKQPWAAAADGLHYFVNFYVLRRQLDDSLPPAAADVTKDMLKANLNKPAMGPGGALVGTAGQAIEYIQTLQRGAAWRITHLPLGVRRCATWGECG